MSDKKLQQRPEDHECPFISVEFCRAVFEESADALFIADRHGRCVAVNRHAIELTGCTRERLIGMTLADVIWPEHLAVEVSARTLPDGHVLRVVRDISERQELEALRESEETYRSLVESAQDPMFRSDANGRYLYVNTAAAALLGKTPRDLVGKTPEDFFPPHVSKQQRAGMMWVIETGQSLVSHELSEINGRQVWFSRVVQPVRDRQGNVTAVQGVIRDVTSLKQAEEALRESEERLRQAVRVSHIGIFDHNHLTGDLYYSAEQRDICGLERSDPVSFSPPPGNPQGTWDLAHPEDQARVTAALCRAHDPEGDGLFDLDHRIVRRDGSVRWLTTRSQTEFAGEGAARHPVRTVGGVIDITERTNAESERERLQAQLVQAQKMESVGRLAGGVAHDFNNMLNVICGYAEMALEQVDPTGPVHGPVEEIQKAARRSAELTGQLLAFARKQTMAPKVLNLNACIASSLNMVGRLIGEDIRPVWMPGHHLWSVRVDPSQIDQVLVNLSVNARDAIAGVGQVTIRTANTVLDDLACAQYPGSVPGEYVMLEVTDDGHGMDAETKSHIFEPFYTTKAEGQGTGLGLATVYGVVKQNEGYIAVSSELGQGTTVKVFWPRFAGAGVVATTLGPTGPPEQGTETVLLVEDEPMVLRLSTRMLDKLGYTVIPANTPKEALRLGKEQGDRIDLLLSDVVMPDMNGRELAKQLLDLCPRVKCVFVSGYSAGSGTAKGILDEGVHFLQKPFTLTDLAAKVREALDTR